MSPKKVLVTDAGRGIGLATARAFAGAGWRVVSLDKEFGDEVVGERLDYDLRRMADISAMAASLGDVDTLVNNAAVLFCDPVDAIPEEHRREILAVNLEAPAALIAALAPGMTARMYDQLPQSRRDDVMRAVYSGRVCEPEEVAATVLWLGSGCPEYVNGTTLDVNNGSYPR